MQYSPSWEANGCLASHENSPHITETEDLVLFSQKHTCPCPESDIS